MASSDRGFGRTWVSLDDDREVTFWTTRFGVDETTLEHALDAVGNSAAEIEQWLAKNPH
jgi:hypothetical protein